ncbi:ATP-binding protein [Pseudanabaena sp. 'Roaring Creek']|uniref:ATP-binding protein n=1 Tax=Pseudanabaena sp. 'Roaring Creek' TaxID=1681830 RepID=UPI000A87173F|nr:ATP-binding protein [Pseudanabaena sp. 'Roaring Creek']
MVHPHPINPTMDLELSRFYKACNPTHPLDSGNEEDRSYYVDLSAVRGARLIESMVRTIARIAPDEATCQLFTGHIGCGKSTELLRLKYLLEQQNFHVVYFECDRQLELSDVDVSDVLLAIVGQISASLDKQEINIFPSYFKKLFDELKDIKDIQSLLKNSVDLSKTFKLSEGIAALISQAKDSPSLRRQMHERLEARTNNIINSINEELLAPAKEKLKQRGVRGLVVIVDNLDRIENRLDPKEQSRAGYLFVERGDQLRKLDCHMIYTVPLRLTFSKDREIVRDRFGTDIKILPMVPVRFANGSICEEGMALLRRFVMLRAFPHAVDGSTQTELISKVFEKLEILDRLCQVTGGHVRNLLRLLSACLQQEDPPITLDLLESIISQERSQNTKNITPEIWELIQNVRNQKRVGGEDNYEKLIKSFLVFEYEYQNESWFDINPLVVEDINLNEESNQSETQNIQGLEEFVDATIVNALNQSSHQYEEYLSQRDYNKASNLANQIYEMCNDIAATLDPEKQGQIYTKVAALSSYWKLSRDLYKGIALN